jgi:hypothetical protein
MQGYGNSRRIKVIPAKKLEVRERGGPQRRVLLKREVVGKGEVYRKPRWKMVIPPNDSLLEVVDGGYRKVCCPNLELVDMFPQEIHRTLCWFCTDGIC